MKKLASIGNFQKTVLREFLPKIQSLERGGVIYRMKVVLFWFISIQLVELLLEVLFSTVQLKIYPSVQKVQKVGIP